MGEESAGMVQSVDEVVFGMGACYWDTHTADRVLYCQAN